MTTRAKNPGRQEHGASGETNSRRRLTVWLAPTVIFAVSFAAFYPALQNEFLNWDDDAILLGDAKFRGLGWTNLSWMFTTFRHSLYRPLTWITWGIDYLIWGLNPFGYHLTSLLFHCANAVVFYFIALRLLRLAMAVPDRSALPMCFSAAIAGLAFAVHPLRVEPVAWVSGRENVVSGLFFLLTILFYLKAVETPERNSRYRAWMSAAWVVFAMSLLAKAAGMTLPFALLILDAYPLRRLQPAPRAWFRRDVLNVWLEKIPFLLLGVVAGVIGWLAKAQAGAMVTWQDYGLLSRLAQSIYGLAFYLWKTAVPLNLSPLYEMPQTIGTWYGSIAASGIVVGLVTAGFFIIRKSYPAGLGCWLFYVVIVAPVLGITQSGPQIAADRYTYLSGLGWPLLASGGVYYCWKSRNGSRSNKGLLRHSLALAVVLILCLGMLSWRQTSVWRDSERLWRHTLSIGPSIIAHRHLGLLLEKRGDLEEAIKHYRKAIEIKPDYFDARRGLAGALAKKGELEEAARHYRHALKIFPASSDLRVNLGNLLAVQGQRDEAIQLYQEALRIDPASGNAYFNLGNMFALMGQSEKALESYRQAVIVQPTHSDAHFSIANVLARQGRLDEAVHHYQQSVKHKPDFAEAHHNLGRVLAARGQLDDAVERFRHAVRLRPEFAEAHESLSQALAEQGKTEEAIGHHREAARLINLNRGASASPPALKRR